MEAVTQSGWCRYFPCSPDYSYHFDGCRSLEEVCVLCLGFDAEVADGVEFSRSVLGYGRSSPCVDFPCGCPFYCQSCCSFGYPFDYPYVAPLADPYGSYPFSSCHGKCQPKSCPCVCLPFLASPSPFAERATPDRRPSQFFVGACLQVHVLGPAEQLCVLLGKLWSGEASHLARELAPSPLRPESMERLRTLTFLGTGYHL